MKKWFVATTKHQQEQSAAANLRAQAFGVFLAKTYRRQEVGRKIETITALRFPGYVFIEFDRENDEHGPISHTRGIDELLCRKDESRTPLALRPGIVDLLRQVEDEEFARASARRRPPPRDDLRAGDMVRIDRHDYFRGYEGRLCAVDRGIATVLAGTIIITLPEIDLKRVIKELKKAG